MDYPVITHHGALTGVTGSCHQYQTDTANYLIDCGLFQGDEADADLSDFAFDVTAVDALIVTHGHIDHVGRIPWLIAAGFRGPIICSVPTARLLPIILRDALQINIRDNKALIDATIARLTSQLVALEFNQWFTALPVPIRLQNAAHILGSAYVELQYNEHCCVFSGDLGAPGGTFVDDLCSPERANTVVLESTYGDRNHEQREERSLRLAALVNKAMQNNGTLLIPAFSLGRTQELLATFEQLIHDGLIKLPDNQPLPIILDSPLAGELTAAYRALSSYWPSELLERRDNNRWPLAFDSLITVNTHREHLKLVDRLAKTERPAIVIAASGMCQGGRVMNYLRRLLPLESTEVLFLGYQARGTQGRAIQESKQGDMLTVAGERITLRAEVMSLSGFSAHAGQRDLLAFISGISPLPLDIRLVHGDEPAKRALRGELDKLFTA